MTVEQLVSQLSGVYGNTLRSVILYGSAVAGEHIAKRSDYNVLVVLDSIPLEERPCRQGDEATGAFMVLSVFETVFVRHRRSDPDSTTTNGAQLAG